MKNPFLGTLRHLAEGTRLYGRDQPGQAWGIFALSLYIPLMLPLLSTGVWTDVGRWIEHVVVPSAGILLAAYGVVVAIVIALALTPPGAVNLAPRAPYPVERPVKTRIILNARLFVIAMLGFSTMGIVFTTGMERLEHLVCLGIGAVLLQLGHLDEVNAVQVEPVLERVMDAPLERYDRWYRHKWGVTPQQEPGIGHHQIRTQHLVAVVVLCLIYLATLLLYILGVHGPTGLLQHLLVSVFLSVMAGFVTVRAYEAELLSVMIARHNAGARFDSRFAHAETYFAYVLIGAKLLASAALAVLPVMWFTPNNAPVSVPYLGFLLLDLLVFLRLIQLTGQRWLVAHGKPIRPVSGYDRRYMLFLRKKHAAKERAAIRGAIRYASHHLAARPPEDEAPR